MLGWFKKKQKNRLPDSRIEEPAPEATEQEDKSVVPVHQELDDDSIGDLTSGREPVPPADDATETPAAEKPTAP
ncbi:MAG: hypothetical protein V2I35_09465, partial [Desulfocapsaceae bacterium]|nr:hypothetical protein [Desulfocapsaceae bacterium]